jgi:ABC-type oligopeptide transport system substrate-binding subunit
LYASSQERNGYNFAAYTNPQADVLIDAQNAELDPKRRFELQKRLMDILVDDTAYIPQEYTTNHAALNTAYQGLDYTQDWLWYLPVWNVRPAERNSP